MPVMDGWQCARELRARYGRALPIVVVTAAEHVRARSQELGADRRAAETLRYRRVPAHGGALLRRARVGPVIHRRPLKRPSLRRARRAG